MSIAYAQKNKNAVQTKRESSVSIEGARFMFVREHLGEIRDDSFIYVTCTNPNPYSLRNPPNYIGVKFSILWKHWADVFCKRYNITNETVKNAILGKKDNGIKDPQKLTIATYDKRPPGPSIPLDSEKKTESSSVV